MAEFPTSLIVSARNLLRDITKYYGDEQGMKMWRSLKEGMGEDLQNAVLMGLLRGIKYDLKIRTTSQPRENRKLIEALRAVRHATGYGLKDAKDFMDQVENVGYSTLSISPEADIEEFIKAMTYAGYEVD